MLLILFVNFPTEVKADDNGINIKLDIKSSFKEGETINFKYIIASDRNQQLTFIPSIKCDENIPQPITDELTKNISRNFPYENEYSGTKISKEFPRSNCEAIISISKPAIMIIAKKFTIDTLPEIKIKFLVCKDLECSTEAKNIIADEQVFFYPQSTQSIPSKANIYSGDTLINSLELPSRYSFKEKGSYKVEFVFDLPGFQAKKIVQILEVKKNNKTLSCNNNGICEKDENNKNCPKDCQIITNHIILMAALILGSIIILFFLIFLVLKFKQNR